MRFRPKAAIRIPAAGDPVEPQCQCPLIARKLGIFRSLRRADHAVSGQYASGSCRQSIGAPGSFCGDCVPSVHSARDELEVSALRRRRLCCSFLQCTNASEATAKCTCSNCSGRHSTAITTVHGAQAPIHADKDVGLAHEYALARANLRTPEMSRYVTRMTIDQRKRAPS